MIGSTRNVSARTVSALQSDNVNIATKERPGTKRKTEWWRRAEIFGVFEIVVKERDRELRSCSTVREAAALLTGKTHVESGDESQWRQGDVDAFDTLR